MFSPGRCRPGDLAPFQGAGCFIGLATGGIGLSGSTPGYRLGILRIPLLAAKLGCTLQRVGNTLKRELQRNRRTVQRRSFLGKLVRSAEVFRDIMPLEQSVGFEAFQAKGGRQFVMT